MNAITTPGRLRSVLVKTGAALGSAASAHADDVVEPTAIVAPTEQAESTEQPEQTEPLEAAEPIAPAAPAAAAAPIDPLAAAVATPVANNDFFAGAAGGNDIAPSQLYVNDSDMAPTGLEIDDPAGEVSVVGGWVHIPIAVGFSGNRTFNYRFTNALGTSNWATVTVVVASGVTAPIGYSDIYTTANDVTLMVSAPGVLTNDDSKGGTVTAISDLTGQVVVHPNGSFEYTPVAGFVGVKTFYYQITANGLPSNWAKVTVSVTAGTGTTVAPVAVADNYQTPQGVALDVAAQGVLLNDSSATATVFDTNDSTGEVTLSFNGALHYTPAVGFSGIKTFEYRILDGLQVSNWATITIEVTAAPPVGPVAPVAVNDKYTMDMNTKLDVASPGVLSNDSAGLVFSLGGFYAGVAALDPTGAFSYTPPVGFTGTSVVTYTITANGLTSNVATITVEVVDPQVPSLTSNDPTTPANTPAVRGKLAFSGVDSTWLALPALSIFLLGTLAIGYSAARRRAGTV